MNFRCYVVTVFVTDTLLKINVLEVSFGLWLRNSPPFVKPKGSLPCSREPPKVPVLSRKNPVHTLISHLWNENYTHTFKN
jgi:hypothetical protein